MTVYGARHARPRRPRPVPKRAKSTNPKVRAVEPRLSQNGLNQNGYGGLLGPSRGLLWAS
eukprot:1126967-Pyramimonas_sp.AAC.1